MLLKVVAAILKIRKKVMSNWVPCLTHLDACVEIDTGSLVILEKRKIKKKRWIKKMNESTKLFGKVTKREIVLKSP